MAKALQTIGRIDKIDLPDFGITDLECKVDTGADTSAIHCSRVRLVEKDGKEYLRFRVLAKAHPLFNDETQMVQEFQEKRIKSSNGTSEERYVIKTDVMLFGKKHRIAFTLSDRAKMKYPVLLGRRFLKNRFLVDVAQKDLSYRQKTSNQ